LTLLGFPPDWGARQFFALTVLGKPTFQGALCFWYLALPLQSAWAGQERAKSGQMPRYDFLAIRESRFETRAAQNFDAHPHRNTENGTCYT